MSMGKPSTLVITSREKSSPSRIPPLSWIRNSATFLTGTVILLQTFSHREFVLLIGKSMTLFLSFISRPVLANSNQRDSVEEVLYPSN